MSDSKDSPAAEHSRDASADLADPSKSGSSWIGLALGAGLLVLAAAAVMWWFQRGKLTNDETDEVERRPPRSAPLPVPAELRPVRDANPGYVGAEACGECHQQRLAEFQGTRHYLAACAPRGDQTPTQFTADSPQLTSRNWPFALRPVSADEGYFEQIDGETRLRKISERHRIDMVYGSRGRADEVYFTWRGDQLFELPFAWLHPWNCWGKQIYSDVGDDVLRPTTPRCLECHTTYFEHVPGTPNSYRRDSILPGVTCERCHGPGREHVEYHRANPGSKQGHAITDPRALSRERQLDICGQCHSPALHHRGALFSYRPGDDLETHFRSLTIEGIENDHVANQGKYLRRSRCFQQDESLTCQTCHDPHRPTDPVVVAAACAKCHTETACRAGERLPAAVRGQCVDCHMPRYNRVAVKFRTADDEYLFPMRPREHRIGRYPRAEQEVLLGWHEQQDSADSPAKAQQIRGQLAQAWTEEGDALRANDRLVAAMGAYREAERLEPQGPARAKLAEVIARQSEIDRESINVQYLIMQNRTNEAIAKLEHLLKLSPAQAPLHGKLGTMYEMKGQHVQALEHWNAVEKYDPDDPYGANMRGWTAYLGKRFEEAIEAFQRADAVRPGTAEINYRWGLAALGQGNHALAAERLRVALRANPEHVGAMQAMSHALRGQGHAVEAVPFAEEAARRSDYSSLDMVVSWLDACIDAQRWDEAQDAVDRAKPLARDFTSQRAIDERARQVEAQGSAGPRR